MTNTEDYGKTAWAVVVSTNGKNKNFGAEVIEFTDWYMKKLTVEALQIGIVFNFKKNPSLILETEVGNFESCSKAYQSIFKIAPGTCFVLHVLPEQDSKEHKWMKALSERYGFIRQGLLYENVLNRYSQVDVEKAFRNMAFWVHRSGLQMIRFDQNPCMIKVGTGELTMKKVVYNREDIHEAVISALHGSGVESEADEKTSIKVSGFQPNLNIFGIAQLLAPYRVIGVTKTGVSEAVAVMENVYHAIQACEEDGKVLDRVHTLKVELLSKTA